MLSDSGEIQDADDRRGPAKLLRRPHHERGFAHLAGVEHIAELSVQEARNEFVIRHARDIRGSMQRQRAPGKVKRFFRHSTLISAEMKILSR